MEDLSRGLQIDLAVVQIVTTILITIGATIFAVGVGFDIAVPSLLDSIAGEDIPAGLESSVLSAANNYGFILASAGVMMVVAGILYGSASLAKIRKKGRNL